MKRIVLTIAGLAVAAVVIYMVANPGNQTRPAGQKKDPMVTNDPQGKNDSMPDEHNQSPMANELVVQTNSMPKEYNQLTAREASVILYKGTELPDSGQFNSTTESGVYVCRQCNAKLYRSEDKFEAHCGWPSFDDEIPGSIKRNIDADGYRVEIVCENCGGHLGHVFEGERKTEKNVRHCVNSISMKFYPSNEQPPAMIVK